jgi:predicted transcriptional regulator
MEQRHIRRIRMFLDLRQVDVERATGISVARLSKAEAGGLTLSRPEQVRLNNFLHDRMRIIAEIDNETRCIEPKRFAERVTA